MTFCVIVRSRCCHISFYAIVISLESIELVFSYKRYIYQLVNNNANIHKSTNRCSLSFWNWKINSTAELIMRRNLKYYKIKIDLSKLVGNLFGSRFIYENRLKYTRAFSLNELCCELFFVYLISWSSVAFFILICFLLWNESQHSRLVKFNKDTAKSHKNNSWQKYLVKHYAESFEVASSTDYAHFLNVRDKSFPRTYQRIVFISRRWR